MDLKGFCAAPWVEGVLYANGVFRTCCRNGTVFGDWQKQGIQEGWHSEKFIAFRKSIIEGKFPDDSCEKCYHNGTARTLGSELFVSFEVYSKVVLGFFNQELPEIGDFRSQLTLSQASDHSGQVLTQYFSVLQKLEAKLSSYPIEVQQALNKLTMIGRVVKAFLEGDLRPPVIAPFRSVQLLLKCNARCIHCPGLYDGSIINGPALDEKYIEKAFSHSDQIFDFFMNGSEFLLYKGWKKIADYLVSNGLKPSLSTNSICLTPENIRYLVDNQVVRSLNISMDGATKRTLESIRVNVKFDELVKNMGYLFRYATEKKYDFNLSISFVLMKRNYHEFPQLVRLIHQIRGDYPLPKVHVYCQSLENYVISEEYTDFVNREQHSLVERAKLIETFKETLEVSKSTGISVTAFYFQDFEEFIKQGCPFPPLPDSPFR